MNTPSQYERVRGRNDDVEEEEETADVAFLWNDRPWRVFVNITRADECNNV